MERQIHHTRTKCGIIYGRKVRASTCWGLSHPRRRDQKPRFRAGGTVKPNEAKHMTPDNLILGGLIFTAVVAAIALIAFAASESFLDDDGGDDDIESNYWDVR